MSIETKTFVLSCNHLIERHKKTEADIIESIDEIVKHFYSLPEIWGIDGKWFMQELFTRLNEAGFYRPSMNGYGIGKPGGSGRIKKPISKSIRKQVFERDMYRCKTCDSHIDLCVDHIYPESKGGEAVLNNLQTLCKRCNSIKGSKL